MDHVGKIASLAHDAHCALVALRDELGAASNATVGESLALDFMVLRGAVRPTIDALDRRAPKAERTPETVLRAMLKAYEARILDIAVEYQRTGDPDIQDRQWYAEQDAEDVRAALAGLLANPDGAVLSRLADDTMIVDYEARLAGTRPLNAPPMEEP